MKDKRTVAYQVKLEWMQQAKAVLQIATYPVIWIGLAFVSLYKKIRNSLRQSTAFGCLLRVILIGAIVYLIGLLIYWFIVAFKPLIFAVVAIFALISGVSEASDEEIYRARARRQRKMDRW